MGIDFKSICDEADARDVVEYLGIDHTWKNGRMWILCPDHPDTHFGSCIVNQKGYHCFVCGSNGNTIQMAAKFLNLSNYKAALQIAELYGGAMQYATEDNAEKKFPLSKEELNCLLLSGASAKIPYNFTRYKEELKEYDGKKYMPYITEADGYTVTKESHQSLMEFFYNDPDAFWYMVEGKTQEMIEKYQALLKSGFLDAVLSAEGAYVINTNTRKRIRILKRLQKRIQKEKMTA